MEGTLTLSQKKLVEDILKKFDMVDFNPIQTPMAVPCKLSSNDSPQTIMDEKIMASLPYRQILGSVRYLVSCTRPDLSFCAGFLSRFMQNPRIAHCQALKAGSPLPTTYQRHGTHLPQLPISEFVSTQRMASCSPTRLDGF